MKLLAIETSTRLGGLALVDDETGLLGEIRFNLNVSHSERIMSNLDFLLKSTGLLPANLDAIAVSVGPGSFTGLRVGISTAKGLAFQTGVSIIAVSTLEALASALSYSELQICPMIYARKNEIFTAIYKADKGKLSLKLEESAMSPEDLIALITEPTIFLGNGLTTYIDLLKEKLGNMCYIAPTTLALPSAVSLAETAFRHHSDNPCTSNADTATLTPKYLRPARTKILALP